jgi:Icc-related predicted phosphoesterase
MRIVCISDTHSHHDEIVVPDGDMLIHSGDATWRGGIEEIADFNRWLGTLDHRHKIFVAGNHDWLFETSPGAAEGLLTNATYLRDSSVSIDGLKIYGSPWQPAFMDWAFNLRRGDEIKRKWDLIPNDVDILITHGPPFGILDAVPNRLTDVAECLGCEELIKATTRIKPRLHVFGHIHEGYGMIQLGDTKFVNASICDVAYRPSNAPVVIDL